MDTESLVKKMFAHAERNEWEQFLSFISPQVRWWISADHKDPITLTGIFDLESWLVTVPAALQPRLLGGISTKIVTLNVVGNMAIAEVAGSATQNNGRSYNNRQVWFFVVDESSGKVKEIRDYGNTALIRDVVENNPM
ncbi:hypothetical protein BT69DRAFT_1328356 [Atractiella rhizophila]|nr:hypothetical protein BT69DRAFT_1328356 [Atractiella rhizophila]